MLALCIAFLMSLLSAEFLELSESIKMRAANYEKFFTQEKVIFIDYSKPISEKRLFVIDNKNKKILLSLHVGHAFRSGKKKAEKFSNTVNSRKSSLGLYQVGERYKSNVFLYSYRIHGLENGNSNAYVRGIVIHEQGGDGIIVGNHNNAFYELWSDGCFTLFPEDIKKLSPFLAKGTYLLVLN